MDLITKPVDVQPQSAGRPPSAGLLPPHIVPAAETAAESEQLIRRTCEYCHGRGTLRVKSTATGEECDVTCQACGGSGANALRTK